MLESYAKLYYFFGAVNVNLKDLFFKKGNIIIFETDIVFPLLFYCLISLSFN
jgi:hypothetical protein